MCIVEAGAGGGRAAQEAERAISFFRPSVILFVGIAGGFKDDVKHGDIVIGTKAYEYASGKAGPTFLTRPIAHSSSYGLEQLARRIRRDNLWLERVKDRSTELEPQVHIGAIAAGEVLVKSRDSDLGRLLQSHYNDTLAVEMESHGFYWAAHANEHVRALVVRGISDRIEDKRPEGDAYWQPLAARYACAFAFELLGKVQIDPFSITALVKFDEGQMSKTPTKSFPSQEQVARGLDKRKLREVLAQAFSLEELAILCSDVEQDLTAAGIDNVPVNLGIVGGQGKTAQVLELIEYLDRRGYLDYLVNNARQARPGQI